MTARQIGSCGGKIMYICNDAVCDPCCDFCWYCIHGKNGEPIKCVEMKPDFEDGTGYCDDFKCRLHEPKPLDSRIKAIPHKPLKNGKKNGII